MINRKKTSKRKEQENPWKERVVQVRRVTKVVKGGKKLSFRAVIVIGNQMGTVGVGVGKAGDVIGADKKAVADGKKNLCNVPITKSQSIPHFITGEAGAAKVVMRPSAVGSGVIAGSSTRTVLELAGIQNILTKRLGSNNPLNNARATINALNNLQTASMTALRRGIKVENLYS